MGTGFKINSVHTGDEYFINIIKPESFKAAKKYKLVFIPDGSLGLGLYVAGSNPDWKAEVPGNCVIITIAHTGDYEMKRRRDFIPSDAGGHHDEEFGQAAKFYSFLRKELIPVIDKEFLLQDEKILVGHSLSGLFALYAALQKEQLFQQYFAISPSVWANHHELLKVEQAYAAEHSDLAARIHIYVGGLEVFNKVISSSRKFENVVRSRNYRSLSLDFEKIGKANHFSVRKPAIDRIFEQLSKE